MIRGVSRRLLFVAFSGGGARFSQQQQALLRPARILYPLAELTEAAIPATNVDRVSAANDPLLRLASTQRAAFRDSDRAVRGAIADLAAVAAANDEGVAKATAALNAARAKQRVVRQALRATQRELAARFVVEKKSGGTRRTPSPV